ncbi:MAG: hypothetical protein A2086_10945 [Spirochaetes bacterium GWD1_27_9]|nr:MAG: hypothetical protein A2Z98_00085 [Spirochaetes bacterium GWB1_27_13]OHD20176.1 MAG: hypothetical protein A2Y34_05065 [Spirochaetes bacterium GWC1_27_15]OHD41269.1 MAG: hypothetical protein A2086_10945 [Spirochaetes bacterium GWD1_27_9]
MKKYSLREKIKYSFDNIMSKGTVSLISGLAIISFVIILLISFFVWIGKFAPEEMVADNNFFKIMWISLMRTLDAGTMGGDDGSWVFLLLMFGVTLGGVFIISALIGIITTGLDAKIEQLRKGRSKVIEENHTVILGWSEQVFTVVNELITANENLKKACIAILGDKDKVEMEEELKDKIGNFKNTRVVCRQGNSIEINDLDIVNVNTSKSIIVLSNEEETDPDSSVIKTILAITNNRNRRKEPYNIIAEIRDPKNVEISKIVGKDELEIVLVGDLISRIIAQTCRQPGLSVVYTELLDFGGVEIYFMEEPSLVNKTFQETMYKYNDSLVIGIIDKNKVSKINPPMDTKINEGDSLIFIAEDDSTIKLSTISDYKIDKNNFSIKEISFNKPENILILGWNWRVPTIINNLDNYVSKGSKVIVVSDIEDGEKIIKNQCSNINNLSIKYICNDITNRRILDNLTSEEENHHIIVVCYDNIDIQKADAKTMITLLHLRDISQKTKKDFTIVSEMLDIKNRNLAEIARVNDFIVSDKIISLMLSQISENKYLNAIFMDLFDPEGSEIYLKPATNYVKLNTDVNFYTITESAARKNEIAIGYKIARLSDDAEKAYGVKLNPTKNEILNFAEEDKIVVLAES